MKRWALALMAFMAAAPAFAGDARFIEIHMPVMMVAQVSIPRNTAIR